MKRKRIHCPVCDSTHTLPHYYIERYRFSLRRCAECGVQFRHPPPKNANAFYTEGYYTGRAQYSYQDERRAEHYHNYVHFARLKTIRQFCPVGNFKLLDVGCAFGAFVRAAAHYGKAYGLDVSSYAVDEGNKICAEKKSPARLFLGGLLRLPRGQHAKKIFASGTFSVITLVEVAEHLDRPRLAFSAAYRLLAPGGLLVIQTANFEGWQARIAGAEYHYYLPGHLVYYTATGLKRMLTQIGFSEFHEFMPTDFPLWAKWRKAWGDVRRFSDLMRFWRMSVYHMKSKFKRAGFPLTSSYVLYAKK